VSNDAEFIYDEKDLAQWRAAAKEYNYDLSVFGNVIFLRIKEADKLITEIQREREKKFADSKPYLKGQFIAQIQKKRKGLTPKFGKIYEENQIKNIENTHEFKEKVRMEKEHFDAVLDSVIALLGDIKVFYKRMFERIEAHIKAMEIQIRKIEIKPNPGVAGRGMQHLAQALRAVVGGRRGDNF
jgi:predicted RNase H-like nuclease